MSVVGSRSHREAEVERYRNSVKKTHVVWIIYVNLDVKSGSDPKENGDDHLSSMTIMAIQAEPGRSYLYLHPVGVICCSLTLKNVPEENSLGLFVHIHDSVLALTVILPVQRTHHDEAGGKGLRSSPRGSFLPPEKLLSLVLSGAAINLYYNLSNIMAILEQKVVAQRKKKASTSKAKLCLSSGFFLRFSSCPQRTTGFNF